MRRLLTVVLIILIGLSGLLYAVTNPMVVTKTEVSGIEVAPDSLLRHVMALTSTTGFRNYQNKTALQESMNYIVGSLTASGLQTELQEYKVNGSTYTNVIARYGTTGDPILVIGAHYDVCEDQPGADDNASGVAGLLEIARALTNEQPELDYQIEMVFYTLEEPPFFRTEDMGSAVHAQSLKDSDADVLGMICLEMIGYFSEEKHSQSYPIGLLNLVYPNTGDYIAVVGKMGQGSVVRSVKRSMKETSEVEVRSINAPSWVTGIDFSDHLNYWAQGYDAVMITNTAFYRNDQYHELGDTYDRLNYDNMAEVVEGVYNAAISF